MTIEVSINGVKTMAKTSKAALAALYRCISLACAANAGAKAAKSYRSAWRKALYRRQQRLHAAALAKAATILGGGAREK